ncbi:hypothetical protein ACHAW5_009460 [Stephanodiscus triporus]|uniref:Uncharacterized protein n=1 Tax=Stephanodiscus triporus TaxID=2934178 RepID=A0ABD3NSC4_9STRA
MKADLLLSRPSYRSGTPVVGTVRIHLDCPVATRGRPIRDDIISARLYLSGRASMGGGGGKVSRWRSTQEVNQLKNIYGEHACLTMAAVEERSSWDVWNGVTSEGRAVGSRDKIDNDYVGTPANNRDMPARATFRKKIQPPQVTHIEQAERLAVHSCLHHNSSAKTKHDGGNRKSNDSNAQNVTNNDYSHLPTPHENNVICFWMTNVLELLDVPERHLDRLATETEKRNCELRPGRGKFYGDMNPYRPLQLPDSTVLREIWQEIENETFRRVDSEIICEDSSSKGANGPIKSSSTDKSNLMKQQNTQTAALSPKSAWKRIVASANTSKASAGNDTSSVTPLEQIQLVVSFRASLPPDVPPTMSTECVKYFYSAVLVVTTAEGELLITHCQFAVLTSNSQFCHPYYQISSTRVHIGDLHAIAHSVALPTYISSTEASDATPSQLKVLSDSPACDIVSRHTAEHRTSIHRIQDGDGGYCGSMTLIGIGGPLVPGTRLGIRVRFPIFEDDEISNGAGVIPCQRVCCALVGEEYAIFEGSGRDSLHKGKKRVKTRSYVFDSRYELVEFGYTEAISMALVLPLDCPVTVKTDLVEVTVMLKVEFTVSHMALNVSDKGEQIIDQGEFKVIRVDLPCEVVHGNEESSCLGDGDKEDERRVSSCRKIQRIRNNNNETYDDGFDDIDVQTDLKLLSLRMKNLFGVLDNEH